MLSTINKYPFFDFSEIIPDRDLSYKQTQPLKPIKAGNFVPGFKLSSDYNKWQRYYNGAETHGPILLKQLLNKPLVVSFYSKHWLDIGIEQLTRLNDIQAEIRANGGELLVINAEKENELTKITWEHSFSLNFYTDENNELAEQFSVFSEEDPTWNKFSGIDVNVPLLATYVIDSSRRIIYDHIDWKLSGSFSSKDILSAVYDAALVTARKSA